MQMNSLEEDPLEFLKLMVEYESMIQQLKKLIRLYPNKSPLVNDQTIVRTLGEPFQIRAIEAFPCALWILARYWNHPEKGIIVAVMMGGDTDTVASIAGALLGSLHGSEWIPERWYENLENGDRGRDDIINLAKKLFKLGKKYQSED